jgi:hypothetical protein
MTTGTESPVEKENDLDIYVRRIAKSLVDKQFLEIKSLNRW